MGEFLLIHPLIMGLLGVLAAIIKFAIGRVENGFSRLLIGFWFIWVFLQPNIDSITQRVVGRWVVASLLLVEVLGHVIYRYFRNKYAKAIQSASEEIA